MKKFIIIALLLLTNVSACSAPEYETKIVFVPGVSESTLKAAINELIQEKFQYEKGRYERLFQRSIADNSDESFVKDIKKVLVAMKDENFVDYSIIPKLKEQGYILETNKYVFDINEVTKSGWEVKSTRRVWEDINADGSPDSYEWGTEYILQKKKGWF